jgi:hypothetical protein
MEGIAAARGADRPTDLKPMSGTVCANTPPARSADAAATADTVNRAIDLSLLTGRT